LIKADIMGRTIHLMLVAEALVWLLGEANNWIPAFFGHEKIEFMLVSVLLRGRAYASQSDLEVWK
jgi:hypothetical protein